MDSAKTTGTDFTCPQCRARRLRQMPSAPEDFVCAQCGAVLAVRLFVRDGVEIRIPELENTLENLLGSLNPAQILRFKQAVVQQAVVYIQTVLPPPEQQDGHATGIAMAQGWLDDPTEQRRQGIMVVAGGECIDGGVRYYDYPAYCLAPAFAAGAENVREAAAEAVSAAMSAESVLAFANPWAAETWPANAVGKYRALAWQIEAVRAIADDAEPPPVC